MTGSWAIIVVGAIVVLSAAALALSPWVAGIALAVALAVWAVIAMLGAGAERRADEEGVSERAGQPAREPTPPAEPSH